MRSTGTGRESDLEWNGWAGNLLGRKNRIRLQKIWAKTRRSKSLEMQPVSEMGRNEDGESLGLPDFCTAIMDDDLHMEGKV